MDELNSLLRRQAASQTRLATEISRLRGALAVGDGAGAAAVAADGLKRLKDDHKVVHAAASKLGKAIDRDHERDLRHLRCDALFGAFSGERSRNSSAPATVFVHTPAVVATPAPCRPHRHARHLRRDR